VFRQDSIASMRQRTDRILVCKGCGKVPSSILRYMVLLERPSSLQTSDNRRIAPGGYARCSTADVSARGTEDIVKEFAGTWRSRSLSARGRLISCRAALAYVHSSRSPRSTIANLASRNSAERLARRPKRLPPAAHQRLLEGGERCFALAEV